MGDTAKRSETAHRAIRARKKRAALGSTYADSDRRPSQKARAHPAEMRPEPCSATPEIRGQCREEPPCTGKPSTRTPHRSSHPVSPTTTGGAPPSPGRRRAPRWPGCPAAGSTWRTRPSTGTRPLTTRTRSRCAASPGTTRSRPSRTRNWPAARPASRTRPAEPVNLDHAAIRRPGTDISPITYGGSLPKALAAADELAAEGISAEVIDLRTLRPLDDAAVTASVARTHRAVVIDEAWRTGSLAAEVSARIAESRSTTWTRPSSGCAARRCPCRTPGGWRRPPCPRSPTSSRPPTGRWTDHGRVHHAAPRRGHGRGNAPAAARAHESPTTKRQAS
ncbi:1-deoxy-D-xylulose-5-phosphate synthase [Streptomyces aurantiogriseus]